MREPQAYGNAGGPCQEFLIFFRKNLTFPKIVPQCRKYPIAYLFTLRRTIALPNANAYLNTCTPISIHALPILIHWFGFQLQILIHALPILIPWVGFRLRILIHRIDTTCLDSTREPSAAKQNQVLRHQSCQNRLSATNQNRLLRHPSRQPIRIEHYVTRVEHYVTRELMVRVEDRSRLSAWVGSLKPILIHSVFKPPTDQLTLLLLEELLKWILEFFSKIVVLRNVLGLRSKIFEFLKRMSTGLYQFESTCPEEFLMIVFRFNQSRSHSSSRSLRKNYQVFEELLLGRLTKRHSICPEKICG